MLPIPHHQYRHDEPTVPLTWYRAKLDGVPTVYLVCKCGRRPPLSTSHDIADDGTVTPSVWCHPDDGGCSFHEMIKLEGYASV